MISIKDVSRSGNVTRWHSVRTKRAQNLSEHHYLVTMYARRLFIDIVNSGSEELLLLMEYCLLHDTPELLMGDMPTPVKRKIQSFCDDHEYINPILIIEKSICPEVSDLSDKINGTPLYYIAKAADLIDAYHFLREEGEGKHSEIVLTKVRDQLDKLIAGANKDFPKYNWEIINTVIDELLYGVDNMLEFE